MWQTAEKVDVCGEAGAWGRWSRTQPLFRRRYLWNALGKQFHSTHLRIWPCIRRWQLYTHTQGWIVNTLVETRNARLETISNAVDNQRLQRKQSPWTFNLFALLPNNFWHQHIFRVLALRPTYAERFLSILVVVIGPMIFFYDDDVYYYHHLLLTLLAAHKIEW